MDQAKLEEVEDGEPLSALQRAVDEDIAFFDTTDLYDRHIRAMITTAEAACLRSVSTIPFDTRPQL